MARSITLLSSSSCTAAAEEPLHPGVARAKGSLPAPSPYRDGQSRSSGMHEEYLRLKVLAAAPRSSRGFAIGERVPTEARSAYERHRLDERDLPRADRVLLESGTQSEDVGALLCLRCRVSQAVHQKLLALHRQFGAAHQLDLVDMAATVLDDQGAPLNWEPAEAKSGPEPFTMTVLRGFRPGRAGLATWSRVMVQSHPELVQLLRSHGLLLIRDWALLAHASAARMQRAWQLHGRDALPSQRVRSLHQLFGEQYAFCPGTDSGQWQPDEPFLRRVDPGTPPERLRSALQAMARAVRQERLGAPPPLGWREAEPPEAESRDWLPLQQQLNTCLQQALQEQLPAMLGLGRADQALRSALWRGYTEGLSQRAMAERCAGPEPPNQSTVSRKLQLQGHLSAIAIAATQRLRGEKGFEELGRTPADSDRIVAELRSYLLQPQEGDGRSRLAHWLLPLLPPP